MSRFDLVSKRFPSERIPQACLDEPCIVGIDEAGRGPVLAPVSKLNWLAENGANDSKQLTEEIREAFFKKLLSEDDTMGWRATLLHPEHISNCMLRKDKINLNELSFSTVYDLIGSLVEKGVRIKSAFVDTLGKPEKYQGELSKRFPKIEFTVRSKADALFPVVGAASIVAKVLRDDVLRIMGVTNASGYPGDAATVAWLEDNVDPVFGFPRIVRFSWGSCAHLLQSKCHKVRWLDAEDESNGGKENKRQRSSGIRSSSLPISPFGFSVVRSRLDSL